MRLIVKFWKDESAATAIEYGLIATGIAVAVIPVITGLGTKLKTTFSTVSTAIKYPRRRHGAKARWRRSSFSQTETGQRDVRARCGGSHANDDFAEMRARGHVLIGRLRLVEAEHLVDHRLDRVGRDGGVHRLEHFRRADRDALHIGAPAEDQSRIELGRSPAQAADHRDLAADADGAERARQGAGGADFDDPIDAAAAADRDRRLLPIRCGLVVDGM